MFLIIDISLFNSSSNDVWIAAQFFMGIFYSFRVLLLGDECDSKVNMYSAKFTSSFLLFDRIPLTQTLLYHCSLLWFSPVKPIWTCMSTGVWLRSHRTFCGIFEEEIQEKRLRFIIFINVHYGSTIIFYPYYQDISELE